MKNVLVLGSTGSIGTQTLEVCAKCNEAFSIYGIVGNKNINLLIEQVMQFKPKWVGTFYKDGYQKLCDFVKGFDPDIKVILGESGVRKIIDDENVDIVLAGISGFAGFSSTVYAIEKKKKIALANKETLVVGGSFITKLAKKNGVKIIPVDSEHSAIFQCIGNEEKYVNKIILTASGGPFRDYSYEDLKGVTIEDTLRHPNWNMGNKITVDSATLVNKGLEVIEAHHLFNIDYDNIDVLIHRESIVHSMVEFKDSSVIAQLGNPTMKLPIMYGLSYPERIDISLPKLSLSEIGKLTFEKPKVYFRALDLAFKAGIIGDSMALVFNSSNEVAVEMFLQAKISFLRITDIIEDALNHFIAKKSESIEEIFERDRLVREYVYKKWS